MNQQEFVSKRLSRWVDLHEHHRKSWIFRGQRDARWSLETSLERVCRALDGGLSAAQKRERYVFREFRRRFHHYSTQIPDDNDALRWLAIMQHHGAPTRLLDWSYSVYVAAYFALEGSSEDCAVWAMDAKWAVEESAKLFEQAGRGPEATYIRKSIEEGDASLFGKAFMDGSAIACACPMNPFRLNERLTIQKGVFVVPGDISRSFRDNMVALPGHDNEAHLVKLIIPHVERAEAIERLHYMNITRATLFPGLDGFAESLKVYQPPPMAGDVL